MTRHCRGARVPLTLGHRAKCTYTRARLGVPVTSSDPLGLSPICIHRVVRGTATGCIYTGVYTRARGDQHVDPEPALSGSHRPHQHHSITRGTLWNHLPNHLVTSTQRNATARHTVSFRGLRRLFRARLREGERRGEEGRSAGSLQSRRKWISGMEGRGREGQMTGCEGYCVSPRGTQCLSSSNIADASFASLCHRVSLPCWFRVISLWWRYNSLADARRLDSLWRRAAARVIHWGGSGVGFSLGRIFYKKSSF